MANKPSSDKASHSTALQRGKACLRCRKRKMKCDGAKPSCQQCVRAKKGEGCEYDDGKGKTRTQLLKETIVKLEQRVRELEDTTNIATAPPVVLFDPATHDNYYSGSSPSSSFDSPDSTYLSAFPHSGEGSPSTSWEQLQGINSPMSGPLMSNIFFDDHQAAFSPASTDAAILDIFQSHSRQCGLEIDMEDLRERCLRSAPSERPTSLMNAIYLWSCFASRPDVLSQHEDHYLRLTLESLPETLRANSLIEAIQASCLVSLYFLANGRFAEGSYHANAAAALADQAGLGQAPNPEEYPLSKLTKSDAESKRILAFWQVYNLDRCWSVVLQKKPIISDGPNPKNLITCPWPQEISEYKLGHVDGYQGATIQTFLAGHVSTAGFSSPALRVKASALFYQADRLAKQWVPGTKISAQLIDEINCLERAIGCFIPTVVPIHQLDAVPQEEKLNGIVAHTLVQTALIHLYSPFVAENPVSAEKSSTAARTCVSIINYINDSDFVFLDPIIGPCWSTVADRTISRLDNASRSWPPVEDTSELANELRILHYAMTRFSIHFPVINQALSRVQKRLA